MLVRKYWKSVFKNNTEILLKRGFTTNTTHPLSLQEQANLLNQITSDLKFKNQEDLYKLSSVELRKRGGEELLKYYKHPLDLLTALYPQHEWLPWKFDVTPKNYWNDSNNQRKFMDWAAKQLSIIDMSDWYKITVKDIENIGGGNLLKDKYSGSPSMLLSSVYPEYDWLPWRFPLTPKNYWENVNNQRKFTDWAFKELKLKEMSDWYNITIKDFETIRGTNFLMTKYNGSISLLLSTVYPEYNWLPWQFVHTPKNFWTDDNNIKKFFDWAGPKLGVKQLSDWYDVIANDIVALGGKNLLSKHKFSLPHLLSIAYPNFNWEPHLFTSVSLQNWTDVFQDETSKQNFVKYLETQLGIEKEQDWNNVLQTHLQGIKLPPTWKLREVLALVRDVYQTSSVIKSKLASHKKSQHILKSLLKTMFPQEEILEEYRHPDLSLPSGFALELDLFYPKLNIAFEYQGQQHYNKAMKFLHNVSSFEERKNIDIQKISLCKEKGITLIEVPFWWDRKFESLAATVYSLRPDLFAEPPTGKPIPLNAPSDTQKSINRSEAEIKKSLMTSTVWEVESMDPTGWWMSEKYDGMRLYWNGSAFFTRQGKKIKVPEFIVGQLPSIALDGELWTQYGLHQDAVSLSKGGDDEKWRKAIFWVFDAPDMANKLFEERIQYLNDIKEQQLLPSFVQLVNMVKCEGKQHLQNYFNEILKNGGEGVMLRESGSLYTSGRSESLRKFKPFIDTEVKVIENNYPHGFHCQQANGKTIFVGLSDNYEEAKKVKEGAVITVKHQGANVYGTLQYPKFYRERTDVKWHDLINT